MCLHLGDRTRKRLLLGERSVSHDTVIYITRPFNLPLIIIERQVHSNDERTFVGLQVFRVFLLTVTLS